MHVLLFANGIAHPGKWLSRALDGACAAHILCADGGALIARGFGFAPDTIIGDCDSLSEDQLADFAAAGARIIRHRAEKDETDLELALQWCIQRSASRIQIIGALGGRIDQTLANIFLLTLPGLRQIPTEIVDGEQCLRLLRPGRHDISGRAGDTISLIPLGDAVDGIVSAGLRYPLRGESLVLGPARGISNVLAAERARLEIEAGELLLTHTLGRA